MAVFCENSEQLSRSLRASIETRLRGSYQLGTDGKPLDSSVDLLEGADGKKVTLYFLSILPARLFEFLL
jgi:hypothetical protein